MRELKKIVFFLFFFKYSPTIWQITLIKFCILNSYIFISFITFNNTVEDLHLFHDNTNFRVLIFASCDELYSHYIPIFCDTILKADKLKRIDIEIHLGYQNLSENEEKAISFIRKKYYYSKIEIKYNIFIKNETATFFNNNKVETGSIRFLLSLQ